MVSIPFGFNDLNLSIIYSKEVSLSLCLNYIILEGVCQELFYFFSTFFLTSLHTRQGFGASFTSPLKCLYCITSCAICQELFFPQFLFHGLVLAVAVSQNFRFDFHIFQARVSLYKTALF